MAGKGSGRSRKRSKKPVKPALSVEKFAYDAMSTVLQICGFPTEKIPVKESKMSECSRSSFLWTNSFVTLTTALGYRDKWRRMFESRFRSSGLDDIKKIEQYLGAFLSLDYEYKISDDVTKTRILLALYSEIIQFLNFKGAEVDFEQMLNSWICYFKKNIAKNQCTDKLLQELLTEATDADGFLRGVTEFIEEHATPYGKTDEISEKFREFSAAQFRCELERQIRVELAQENIFEHLGFVPPNIQGETDSSGAVMSQSSCERLLEMGADFPGDRSSSDSGKCPFLQDFISRPKSGKPSAEEMAVFAALESHPGKCPRKQFAKETGVSEGLPGKSPTKPSDKETGASESLVGDQGSSRSEMVESRFESMKLDDETVSQKTQGAIPKRAYAKAKDDTICSPEGSERTTASSEHNVIDRLGSASSSHEESYASPDILLGLGTDLPGDSDSSDSAEHPEGDVDKSLEPSGRRSAGATGTLEGQSVKPKRKLSSKKKR